MGAQTRINFMPSSKKINCCHVIIKEPKKTLRNSLTLYSRKTKGIRNIHIKHMSGFEQTFFISQDGGLKWHITVPFLSFYRIAHVFLTALSSSAKVLLSPQFIQSLIIRWKYTQLLSVYKKYLKKFFIVKVKNFGNYNQSHASRKIDCFGSTLGRSLLIRFYAHTFKISRGHWQEEVKQQYLKSTVIF